MIIVEAQSQLTAAVEKERSSTEKALTLQSRVTQLEKQTASLRQEKSRLTAALELEKAKAETLEEGQQRYILIVIWLYTIQMFFHWVEIQLRWKLYVHLYSSLWKMLGKKRQVVSHFIQSFITYTCITICVGDAGKTTGVWESEIRGRE